MALALALSAVVQWNDPDPFPWVAGYGTAALLVATHATGRTLPWLLTGSLALLLAGFALRFSPSVFEADLGAYTAVGMRDTGAEEAREAIGLWIAALCCAWIAWRQRVARVAGTL